MDSVLSSKVNSNIINSYLKVNEHLVGCNALSLGRFENEVVDDLLKINDLNLPTAFTSDAYINSLGIDSTFEKLIYSCLLISSFVKQINSKLQEHQIVNCNFKLLEIQHSELESLIILFSRVMKIRGYVVIPGNCGCYIINCPISVSNLDIECLISAKTKSDINVDIKLNSAITESLIYSASISKLNEIPKNNIIKEYYKNLLNVREKLLANTELDIQTLWDACYMETYMYVYFNCLSSTDEALIGTLQEPSLGNLIILDSLMRNKVKHIQQLISDLKACEFLLRSFDKIKLRTGREILKLNFMKNIEMVSMYFDSDCNITKVRFINEKEMQYILYTLVKTNKPNLQPIDLDKLIDTTFDDNLFGCHHTYNSEEHSTLEELMYVLNYIINKLKNKDLYSTKNLIKIKEDIKPRLANFDAVELIGCNKYIISVMLLLVLALLIRLVTW